VLGQLANQEMERVAGLSVSDLASKGMALDYTPASLGKADQLLANYGHSKGNGQANMGLVKLVGAYFGEVLRRNLGGNWFENVPADNATGLLLDEKFAFWVWCPTNVYKQREAGNKSLAFIFSDASTRLQDWRGQASHGA
jgi:hypothetical protein